MDWWILYDIERDKESSSVLNWMLIKSNFELTLLVVNVKDSAVRYRGLLWFDFNVYCKQMEEHVFEFDYTVIAV